MFKSTIKGLRAYVYEECGLFAPLSETIGFSLFRKGI